MQDLLNEVFERPSRLLGWGVVVVVHLIAWQVLVHGLNWVNVIPALKAVEVTFVNDEAPPPPPPPAVPRVEQPVTTEVFVPTPEVVVKQESTMLVAATPVPPPAMVTSVTTTAATAVYSPSPVIVSESDVDWLIKPEIHFPQASRRNKEHGMVLLSVLVNSRGLVEAVNVFKSSGFARLDECAARALCNVRVKPLIKNGVAIAYEVRIPIEFPS